MIFALTTVIVGLVLIEGFSAIIWYVLPHSVPQADGELLQELVTGAVEKRVVRQQTRIDLHAWSDILPHPYFGYVEAPGANVNNYGFEEQVDYPYQKAPDEFVVGLLGGSVGMHLANYLHRLDGAPLKAQLELLPLVGDRKVRILQFCQGGYKEPQQFIVLSYFLEMLDLVVVVDGHNELTSAMRDDSPIEYPSFIALYSFFKHYFDKEQMLELGTLAMVLELEHRVAALALRAETWPSFTVRLVLGRLAHALTTQRKELAMYTERDTLKRELVLPGRTEHDERAITSRAVEVWRKYTILSHLIAQHKGIPIFTFLQPNQYVEGSKPLSPEEDTEAIDPNAKPIWAERWRHLLGAAADLRATELQVYDLTKLFAEERRTLYYDKCCHFNEIGLDLLSRAIGQQIFQALTRNRSAAEVVRGPRANRGDTSCDALPGHGLP